MIATVPALIDLNVALALVDGDHACHRAAGEWMQTQAPQDVIITRVVQLGLLRLLSSSSVMRGQPLTMEDCWALWATLLGDERIRFVTAEPPGIENAFKRFTDKPERSPKRWTDAYLAAFSVAGQYTLVSFDRGFKDFPGLHQLILGAP